MNLRDLEYVVAVADLRHFGRAAKQCHVSQPTLSAQVKKLEEELEVAIFERTNRSVMPTETGAVIIEIARRMLSDAEGIREVAAAAKHPLAGRFRLGAFPTLASYLFPHILPRLREAMPDLRLVFVEEKSDDLIDQLRRGQLDAAFLALPIEEDGFTVQPLFDDEFLVAVGSGHPLARRASVNASALSEHRLLLLDEGHCLRDQSLEVCDLMGVAEETDFRATSLETLRQMVRADTGVTLMPEIAVRDDDPDIAYVPFAGKPPARTIALVRRKTSARVAIFDNVTEAVQAWASLARSERAGRSTTSGKKRKSNARRSR